MASFGVNPNTGPSPTQNLNPFPVSQDQTSPTDILGTITATSVPPVDCSTPSPGTGCDEQHAFETRFAEQSLPGILAFGAAGTLTLFNTKQNTQIFEIDIQPDAAVTLQILEGNIPIDGAWIFAANQWYKWTGKFTNQQINLAASAACNVHFVVRYRSY